MRIKSYFACTVEDAVDAARQELGADAMLVHSRRTPPESSRLGQYEVVFGLHAPPAETEPGPSGAPAPMAWPAGERLSTEVAERKKKLEGMRRALTRSSYDASLRPVALAPDLADALGTLAAAEMPPELAREVVQASEARVASALPAFEYGAPRSDGAVFQRALVEELESSIGVQPVLGRSEARPRLVALETATALAQAIEENRGKDPIFIDTPGLGFGDVDHSPGLARFPTTRSDIDTHLVQPASMKSADLARSVDCLEVFGPRRLLFSKLDETGSFGPLFGEAARCSKPLSFFTTGQRIPEDIEAASGTRLIDLVLAGQGARAQSAA
jgi:flagellar biosynthesis GTPase FlhF